MLERRYRLDPWLALASVALPIIVSLPFLYTNPWTQASATLVLAVKTLGLLPAPGYPLYLWFTHALATLLPFTSWLARVQLVHILYLGVFSGLLFQLGRSLAFPPLVSLSAALSVVFSLWIWPDVLVPIPLTLNLCFLLLFFIFSLRLQNQPPTRFVRLHVLLWGVLGGIAAGQECWFWMWVLPMLVLGVWTLPGKRSMAPTAWLWLLVGLIAGTLAPYTYLLTRLFSSQAFFNSDLVPQFSTWRASPTLELLQQWLRFYFNHLHTWAPGLSSAHMGVSGFLSSLPFLTIFCFGIGTIIHVKLLLFQPVRPPVGDHAYAGRLLCGGLPWLALLGTAIFWHEQPGALALACVLSGTLWGYAGFNYVYEELGYPSVAIVKSKINPVPTLFGIGLLILLPLLSWLYTYPRLQAISRQAQATVTPYSETRAFVSQLPLKALLVFSQHTDGHDIAYAQLMEALRPDVQRLTWSEAWPDRLYTGRTVLELLGSTDESRLRRRLSFADYWNQALYLELQTGRPAYFLAPRLQPNPLTEAFLRRFELMPVRHFDKPLALGSKRTLHVFQVHPQRIRLESLPEGTRPIGLFDHALRLWKTDGLANAPQQTRDGWLSFRLIWERLPAARTHTYLLEFRAVALPDRNQPRPDPVPVTLGQRSWIQDENPPAEFTTPFSETYQFFLPVNFAPGRYQLYAALWDVTSKEWIPAFKTLGMPGYGVLVGEFVSERERP